MLVPENDWNRMAVHVQAELQRLADAQEKLANELTTFRIEVKSELATLKVKAGVWGLVGAAFPVALMLAVEYLKH
jgi:VIT1/CCC1 family predicted Fe2+/Mn2+ transporter